MPYASYTMTRSKKYGYLCVSTMKLYGEKWQ